MNYLKEKHGFYLDNNGIVAHVKDAHAAPVVRPSPSRYAVDVERAAH